MEDLRQADAAVRNEHVINDHAPLNCVRTQHQCRGERMEYLRQTDAAARRCRNERMTAVERNDVVGKFIAMSRSTPLEGVV